MKVLTLVLKHIVHGNVHFFPRKSLGSPISACASTAMGIVGETSGSVTVIILPMMDGVS